MKAGGFLKKKMAARRRGEWSKGGGFIFWLFVILLLVMGASTGANVVAFLFFVFVIPFAIAPLWPLDLWAADYLPWLLPWVTFGAVCLFLLSVRRLKRQRPDLGVIIPAYCVASIVAGVLGFDTFAYNGTTMVNGETTGMTLDLRSVKSAGTVAGWKMHDDTDVWPFLADEDVLDKLNTYMDRPMLPREHHIAMIVLEGRGDLFGLTPARERNASDERRWMLIRKRLASRAKIYRLWNADGLEYKADGDYVFMTMRGFGP
jgi:hypothetical protein